MADRLNGYRILILETREEAQFSRLLTEQGADVLQCPMFTIHDAPDPAPIEAWIHRCVDKPFDDLVLMTGEGLRRLMKVARRVGIDQNFIAALGKARKFARGPKPGRALREIGLEPQVTTENLARAKASNDSRERTRYRQLMTLFNATRASCQGLGAELWVVGQQVQEQGALRAR